MSILIRGMEIPKSCAYCPMLEGDRMDGLCHAASKWLDDDEHWTWYVYPEGDMDDSKPCNCPLVPVQEHGRLIDAEKIYDAVEQRYRMSSGIEHRCERDLLDLICTAPTVIEAEEGET